MVLAVVCGETCSVFINPFPAGNFAVAIDSFSFPAVFPAVAFEKNLSKNTIDLLNLHGKFSYGFAPSELCK